MDALFNMKRKKLVYLLCVLVPFVALCAWWLTKGLADNTAFLLSWSPLQKAAAIFNTAVFTVSMEYYARYAHKELWHGPSLWHVHQTHHVHDKESIVEFNDIFG
jgi:hypothetical protein